MRSGAVPRVASGGGTRHFLRDGSGRVLAETDGSGAVLVEYLWIDDRLVADVAAGRTRFYHADHLGSTLALTDDSGSVVGAWGYDPYGRVSGHTGAETTRFTFVGTLGVEDEGEGLYLMGPRLYDASMGTFLERDPIGFAGGTNLYAYAEGRPTTLVDPKGTNPWLVTVRAFALREWMRPMRAPSARALDALRGASLGQLGPSRPPLGVQVVVQRPVSIGWTGRTRAAPTRGVGEAHARTVATSLRGHCVRAGLAGAAGTGVSLLQFGEPPGF